MGMRYCQHCNLAKASNQVQYYNGIAICPKCHRKMRDMGHAISEVSSEEALKDYDALNQDKDQSWIRGKTVHYQRNDIDETLLECEDRLKLDPEDVEANFTLGKLLFIRGRKDRAKKHLLKVLDVNPFHSEAYDYLHQYFPEEVAHLEVPEIDSKTQDIKSLYEMARRYLRTQKKALAMSLFEAIFKRDYYFIPARRSLADYYLRKEDYVSAISQLNIIRGLKIDDFQIDYNLGIACYYNGDLKRARECFKEAYEKCKETEELAEIEAMIQNLDAELS